MKRGGAGFVMLVLGLSACGDATAPDAGLDAALDGAVDSGTTATAPAIPWLDAGTPITPSPCPDGWHVDDSARFDFCTPYEGGAPAACAPGEAHFVGEPGCAPVGAACPAGVFPDDAPTDGSALFVSADADAGGDGSRARPYATLSEVSWLSLGPGTVVVIGRGTYEGTINLRPGVSVRGACPEATTLTGVDGPVPSVVRVDRTGAEASVQDLTIAAARQNGVIVVDGGVLRLTGVIIEGASHYGVDVEGAGSTATLDRVVVRGTRTLGTGLQSAGLRARRGATVTGRRVIFESNDETGVYVVSDTTQVTLEDVAVIDSRPIPRPIAYGRGLSVDLGASLSLTRAYLAGNHGNGLFVWEAGSRAELADVVVLDTIRAPETLGVGIGISVKDGAQLSATRLTVAGSALGALSVGDGSEATITDALLVDVGSSATSEALVLGVSVAGSRMSLSRVVVAESKEYGIWAVESGTDLALEDVLVTETRPGGSRGSGFGLVILNGASATTDRVVVERSREAGVIVSVTESALTSRDLLIRDTLPREGIAASGSFGLLVDGGSFDGERVAIERADIGFLGYYGSVSTLRDLRIDDIDRGDCGSECIAGGYGLAIHSATATVERFAISDVELCGVFLSQGLLPTELDLRDGAVQRAAIGACVQVPGFDTGRLTNGVQYVDNGINLDSDSTLPVPEIPML